MAKTDSFRVQHKEIAEIVTSIEEKLSPAAVESEAGEIRTLLSALTGKLLVHLTMEDKSLYPSITGSTDDETKKVADEFMAEVGALADAFRDYVGAWPTASSIEGDVAGFITQTQAVFGALKDRIQREETVLYPLVDAL